MRARLKPRARARPCSPRPKPTSPGRFGLGPPTTTGGEAGVAGSGSGDTVAQLQRSAMETNDLGFVASLMFVLVPAVFLIILYIQTNSRQS